MTDELTPTIKYYHVAGGKKKDKSKMGENLERVTNLKEMSSDELKRCAKDEVLVINILRNRSRIFRIIKRVFSCILNTSEIFDGGEFKNKLMVRSEDVFKQAEMVADTIAKIVIESTPKSESMDPIPLPPKLPSYVPEGIPAN